MISNHFLNSTFGCLGCGKLLCDVAMFSFRFLSLSPFPQGSNFPGGLCASFQQSFDLQMRYGELLHASTAAP